MPRRPTIQLSDWKIATHLAATRAVQRQPGSPAVGCSCRWCLNWRRQASRILPQTLQGQMQRFGLDISCPTEFYAYQVLESGAQCRALFHVVGKLLSGPSVFRQDPVTGRVLHYKELRGHPDSVSLAVLPCREAADFRPHLEDESAGDLLQIDIRLYVSLQAGPVHETSS